VPITLLFQEFCCTNIHSCLCEQLTTKSQYSLTGGMVSSVQSITLETNVMRFGGETWS